MENTTKSEEQILHEVLVVDDEPANLALLEDILGKKGYTIRVAVSGEIALRSIENTLPDLILLDIRMPGMDGYEVCNALKSNPETREIPIIFISALSELSDKVKGFKAGSVDYIIKPFQAQEVLARVNTHLAIRELQLTLETRVKERTSDFITANEKLTREIKERVQAEAELSESEERYRTAIENSNDGVIINNGETIAFVNQKLVQMFGYHSTEDLVGKSIKMLIHPDDREQVIEDALCRQRGEAVPEKYDLKGFCKNNETLDLEVSATKITFLGKPASLSYIRDISGRRKIEQQLRQAQKMEAIGTLAGGIAHDFNNILSVIVGFSEMALEKVPVQNQLKTDLIHIRDAADRATRLVKQILTFSRQHESESTLLFLSEVIKETLGFLRSSLPSTIEINTNIKKGTGAVMADPIQMQQIVMNLCTNAFHAMREKGGTLKVDLDEIDLNKKEAARFTHLSPGLYVKLSVSDTGYGMNDAVKESIFDPFFTTKEQGEGTGLGLSVVYGIVLAHGGGILVDSEPGKGSLFEIYIPRIKESQKKLAVEQESMMPRGTECILLVDDEPVLARLMQKMLKILGYQVIMKTDPQKALDLFLSQPDYFDLVITDLTMPGITGMDLAQKILNVSPEMPILLCTGQMERISKEEVLATGIGGFLKKPVNHSNLSNAVRSILDRIS